MSDLFSSIKELITRSVEIAAETNDDEKIDYHQNVIESAINYYENIIERANYFMDKNKAKIFNDVLNISTRGEAERALKAYTKSYLLNLGLSLDSTAELGRSLVQLSKQWKIEPSQDWIDVSKYKMGLGEVTTELKYVRDTVEI